MITQNSPARLLPEGWRSNPQFIYCGPQSIFNSPFTLKRGQKPGSTLQKFREYFIDRINNSPDFRSRILALKGKTLVCPNPTCTKYQCHTAIMADWINDYFRHEFDYYLGIKESDPDHYYDLRMSDE